MNESKGEKPQRNRWTGGTYLDYNKRKFYGNFSKTVWRRAIHICLLNRLLFEKPAEAFLAFPEVLVTSLSRFLGVMGRVIDEN